MFIRSTLKNNTIIISDKIASLYVGEHSKDYFGLRGYAVKAELITGSLYLLGVYETKERANEVLGELVLYIKNTYNKNNFGISEYLVPQE